MKYLNLELTNKCALKCSRCARTKEINSLSIGELDLSLLKEALTPQLLAGLEEVDLSGNYGDPIYHSQFLDIVAWFKEHGVPIYMETNGSGRTEAFWQKLAGLLDKEDIVSFSIDGLEQTNHLYREGADWESELKALTIMAGATCKTFWKFIVFKHNQHQINEAKELASQLGVSKFKEVHSSLFYFGQGEQDDPLMPSAEFLAQGLRKKIQGQVESVEGQKLIRPKCQLKERHYISADGFYVPCCWAGHLETLRDPALSPLFEKMNIKNQGLAEILNSPELKAFQELWSDYDKAPKVCRQKCSELVERQALNTSHDFHPSDL